MTHGGIDALIAEREARFRADCLRTRAAAATGTRRPIDAFRRAFEEAFDADDTERIEALVDENPTQFVPLFEKYARVWIELKSEPRLARGTGPTERDGHDPGVSDA